MMIKPYSIIMREVNKTTGEIAVKICGKGSLDFIIERYNYLKLRSIFNPELTFYIALKEEEKEAIKELENKIVKESNLFIKI